MPPKKLGIKTPPVRLNASTIRFLFNLGWIICVHKAAKNPPNAPTVRHAAMLV